MIRDMNLTGEQVIVWGGMRRELLLEEFVTKHACNLKDIITTIFIIFKFQAHQHLTDLYERVLL